MKDSMTEYYRISCTESLTWIRVLLVLLRKNIEVRWSLKRYKLIGMIRWTDWVGFKLSDSKGANRRFFDLFILLVILISPFLTLVEFDHHGCRMDPIDLLTTLHFLIDYNHQRINVQPKTCYFQETKLSPFLRQKFLFPWISRLKHRPLLGSEQLLMRFIFCLHCVSEVYRNSKHFAQIFYTGREVSASLLGSRMHAVAESFHSFRVS